MKKILLLILMSVAVFAQNFTGAKYYINPGHGGHDPANDRFIPETGFWESDGNVAKGLYLRDIMQGYGANITMSRVTNFDADDKALSTIVAEANAANVDHMHSIHSNATGTTSKANYTLMLYQGTTANPTYAGSKTLADILGPEINKSNRTTDSRIFGDFDFYGTGKPYLGVFKGLNMPGTLSEGSFHDYFPESWRLMSTAYKKHEAIAISRAFIKNFNKTSPTYGVLAGYVRCSDSTVAYTYLNTADSYKPINSCKVTLMPGNKVYYTDNYNNGVFIFDSLNPGTYKLYYECPSFQKDSSEVTVKANESSFGDKMLAIDKTIPALITSYTPANSLTDSVYATSKIIINFSRSIDKTTFESNVKIEPTVAGTYTWSNSDKTVTFKPTSMFVQQTKYKVTVPQTVKSIYGIPLQSEISFNFITKSRAKVTLISTYPANSMKNIPPSSQVVLKFDAKIDQSSISGNFSFTTEAGQSISPKNLSYYVDSLNRGYMVFETQKAMSANTGYKITVKKGVKDINGFALGQDFILNFVTSDFAYVSGNNVDNFEALGTWKKPAFSKLTINTDTVKSLFTISTTRKFTGSYAGKLNYVFTNKDGLCVVENSAKPSLGTNTIAGVWVWGDLSKNIVQLSIDNNSQQQVIASDTLNWSGWKLVSADLSKINSTSEKLLTSLSIKRSAVGAVYGEVYFDDLQNTVALPIENNNIISVKNYNLSQNYPNPFNPATKITYSLPMNGYISLKIYDILGSEVATLVNETKSAGTYAVDFNASNLSSGIYFARISSGNFTKTIKMNLIK